MTKITIEQLIWDSWNLEHIKKHHITKTEIETAIRQIQAHKQGYNQRIIFIARSGNRILTIVVAHEVNYAYYIITARDADKKERRILYEKEFEQGPKVYK